MAWSIDLTTGILAPDPDRPSPASCFDRQDSDLCDDDQMNLQTPIEIVRRTLRG